MKTFAAIFFSFLILAVNMKDMAIYICFKINQDYIAQNLCVNRYKPKSCCEGSCQLKKSLEDNDDSNKKNPFTLANNKEFSPFLQLVNKIQLVNISTEKDLFLIETEFYTFYSFSKIYHPPRLLS
jgi:hypothetical protein